MDSALPLLNCLWQQALQSFCSSNASSSSCKWIYSVFWRILPRNFPPPRWDDSQSGFDRSNANKRNWILVWEDGFCDFYECECAGFGFGPEIFFKMSHEVYNFGEGVVGKVAADNSHKWVYRGSQAETDANLVSPWNAAIDPQPKAWEVQFNSGIQTIALIAVREGAIQLGSFDKVDEDINTVISIQRKFNYLQSIPGIFTMQRPYATSSEHFIDAVKHDFQVSKMLRCETRLIYEKEEESNVAASADLSTKNYQKNMVRESFPPVPSSIGMLLSRLPSIASAQTVTTAENSIAQGSYFFRAFNPDCDIKIKHG